MSEKHPKTWVFFPFTLIAYWIFFLFPWLFFLFSLQSSLGIFHVPCHAFLFREKLHFMYSEECALVILGFPDFKFNLFFLVSMKQEVVTLIQKLDPDICN